MDALRATQKDIAKLTDLAQATVSMALADNPRVSKETRKRVHEVAKQLGYRPDPNLTALSAYRKCSKSAKYQATLAWLVNDPESELWGTIPLFYRDYHLGAVERAKELGYQVEEHQLLSNGMTPKRLSGLLWTRNIPGILLSPQAGPNRTMDFDFSKFSVVTFGHTLASPEVHTVVSHQSKSMIKLMEQIMKLGYKRPGLALSKQSNQRTLHNWSSAFWAAQQALPLENRVPMCFEDKITEQNFLPWFKEHRPDVVVTEQKQAPEWLNSVGERIPETLGLAYIALHDENSNYSGIHENSKLIGARALEFLVDLIHRREQGVPEVPLTLMIDGTWVEGTTLRQQSA
ncbi:LacI family DNA-binding transcriptional regulator [Cerasicoccus arenae]|uniref:HTH lacI-type domain-containing protein n=1 Tax=Cerasicoccus arenae TaxID=424488 RepID=A0A8J3DL57_9BACT|nr:LacI family DNA-binding transcriptional regulator [Cerasicoccus arenae]MBK1859286.1 LacI family DNA-binding transcriptional regulator [Cerasicoccus arenae]GHC13334.1 hypothetical protein GCM10007047_33330 [Cerasicoccus arenae]